MTIEQDPLEHHRSPAPGDTTRVVRATSADPGAPAAGRSPIPPSTSPVITAELPVYRTAAPHVTTERSRYTDPRPHGRARRHDPAPIGIRLVVWFIAFVCLVALVALATVHVHPTWLSFLRNTHPAAATTGNADNGPASTPHSGTFALLSSRGNTITYAVPASSFSIEVNPLTDAYVTVKSPPSASAYTFVGVVTAKKSIAVPTTAAVVIARQCRSIVITSGAHTFGTVRSPRVAATYVFTAEGS